MPGGRRRPAQGRGKERGGPRAGERALPAPSPAAFAALGPYAKTRLTVHALSLSLPLDVPGDVFSTQRIDEGTQLLLGYLPARAPTSLLDLGCGYGALGLPVAARFPGARALLVDRDLLAVRASAHNARALGLTNVVALASLGYRDLPAARDVAGAPPYDWLLCNVPARIGAAAIGYLLESGRALLSAEGELRVVVIRDLVPSVEEQARLRSLPVEAVAHGPRHSVFALGAAAGAGTSPPHGRSRSRGEAERAPAQPRARDAQVDGYPETADAHDESVYARDETRLALGAGEHLTLSRPHDVSEDPGHLEALAVLLEALPRTPPARALVFRCGYGALPLAVRLRAPAALVVAQDRDLLDLAFLHRNAAAHSLDGERLRLEAALFPAEAARAGEAFELVLGELSASAGEAVAARELAEAHALLAPGGEALVLLSPRQRREWLPAALPRGGSATVLVERPEGCVLRLSRPRGR